MGVTGVLVVDDDEVIRDTLAELLTEAGYTVWTATNGTSALERLRTHPTGLVVLLDLMMPGMDGYALLQAVAADSSLATQHASILMSATIKTLPLRVVDLLRQLHLSSLQKPFDLEEVLAAVERAAHRLPKGTS